MPSSPIANDGRGEDRQEHEPGWERQPIQGEIGGEARERANRQHIAMREFDDIEDAEEECEPHGDQRIHHAQHERVHNVLRKKPCIH